MSVTVRGTVRGVHLVAVANTREQARADLRDAQEAVRKNEPRIGWRARVRGQSGPGDQITVIDRTDRTVKVRFLGSTATHRWADCEYVW